MEQCYNINFHGGLAKEYGKDTFTIYGRSWLDALEGLYCNLGHKFKQTILTGRWYITKGKRSSLSDEVTEEDSFITQESLGLLFPETEIHIFPIVCGNGLETAAFLASLTTMEAIALGVGVTLGLGAVVAGSMMLMGGASPTMSNYSNAEPVAQKASFIFNGAVNVIEQGGPVPLIYGRHLSGSTVISAGTTTEQL